MALTSEKSQTYDVYVADELHADIGDWTPATHLLPVRIEVKALPGVDVAKFVYYVGDFFEHFDGTAAGTYNPLATLARAYIRVVITDNNGQDPVEVFDWTGVIDRKSVDEISGDVCAGDQTFTAFGLMHELEKHTVTQSKVAPSFTTADDSAAYTIYRGLPFNADDLSPRSDYPGNRHYYGAGHTDSRVFSRSPDAATVDPITGPPARPWKPSEAIEYTLRHDAPSEIQWTLTGQVTALDARLTPTVDRDRRTVAAVLNDLIGRNNGVVARLELKQPTSGFDADRLVAAIVVTSTAATAFSVGTYTFPANDDQRSLIYTNQHVEELEITESGFESFDQVVYEGNWITTTATFALDHDLTEAWDSSDQTEMIDADPSPSESDKLKRAKNADKFRGRDRFRKVFRNFSMHHWSVQPVFDNDPDIPFAYNLSPDPSGTLDSDADIKSVWGFGAQNIDIFRKSFIAPPDPNQDPDERAVVVYFPVSEELELDETPDYENETWQRGDRLNMSGGGIGGRRFTVNVSPDRIRGGDILASENHTGPGVKLNVSGGPQWLIATVEMEDATQVAPENDPRNEDVNGLQWNQAVFTAAIESDFRVEQQWPAGLPSGVGSTPPRVKRVKFEAARLDVALPGTIDHLADDGAAVRVPTTGSIWRDDRVQLLQMAQADFQFSGPSHRVVHFTAPTLNPDSVKIGTMISSVQHSCGTDSCDTVVTSMVIDCKSHTTEVQTSFEELDVVRTLGGRFIAGP